MGASSSTPSPSPSSNLPLSSPPVESGGPSLHPRGLEVRDHSRISKAEQSVKRANSGDIDHAAIVKKDIQFIRDQFVGSYGPEDLAVLYQWRNEAIGRAIGVGSGLTLTAHLILNKFKPQFITPTRRFLLFSAVLTWGGLVGALSSSPKWLRKITEIDRPDSQIKREVLTVIFKHNPRYYEQQVEIRDAQKKRLL
jgi:hypothetical protein